MIHKILIANRGEIAVRVIRACKDLHIKNVAIYTKPDQDCLHVKIADEAYQIGIDPIKGYLDAKRIVEVAKACGADAIHPGYGFLSENYEFAKEVEDAGLVFIGPTADVIRKMGNKNIARYLMNKNGIPIVPGTEKLNNETIENIKLYAERIGYPVILKASGGGGGRGIRVVWKEEELESSFESCKREAKAFFNNDEVFMEKYVVNPRHIEFQILGDKYGNIIHLAERDCSIQRRHQKILEIAPSPTMSESLRKSMGVTAVAAAKAVNYTNAGTIEFLLDDYNNFYFMEMNTRIQVEHGVTEEITGVDLIVRQIRIAAGEISGYYPALGPSVRVDSHLYKDYQIPPFYDSLLAKLIVRAPSYDLAVNKLKRALDEFTIEGSVKTTIPFLLSISKERDFRRGFFDTSYVENKMPTLLEKMKTKDNEDNEEVIAAIAAAIQRVKDARKFKEEHADE